MIPKSIHTIAVPAFANATVRYKVSDRLAMLHEGRIAAVGTPEEIQATHHSLIRDFIEGRVEN